MLTPKNRFGFMMWNPKRLKRIVACTEGVALVELALCIPLLLTIFFGTVEVARYFLAIQKVEKTIDLVTDTVSQSNNNTTDQNLSVPHMQAIMSTVADMMNPYPFGADGVVIITDVFQGSDTSQAPDIVWQFCGGGTLVKNSKIGAYPGKADMQGFVMRANEEIIVGEIFYNFSPITVNEFIGQQQLYRRVFFIPRIGPLHTGSFSSSC